MAEDSQTQVEGSLSAPIHVTFRLRCTAHHKGLGLPGKLASAMMSASVDVANNNGSAECCGTEALRIVIDRPLPGVRVVQVAGELDMVTAPHLDSRLLDQIDKRDGHIVVDLSAVTFLGAAGLTSLVRAREAATCHDIGLHLVGVDHPAVARSLEITQLRPTFAVHPSTGSAITALATTAADRSRR